MRNADVAVMKTNAVAGWHEFGERKYYMRSKAEYRFSCYLEWLKKIGNIHSWEYEPKEFWFEPIKRGCVSYKPDFLVTSNDSSHYWVEVKGYMDAKSKTKISRFKKYFPHEKLEVVDAKWFSRNSKKLKSLVPGWD